MKGKTFRYPYADANPLWKVVKSRGGNCYVCQVIECYDYEGVQKVFAKEEIETSIERDKMFAAMANDHDKFYASLPVGAIVHYHSGFGNFVRCEVTKDKKLLPIALVGKWSTFDLPSRHKNGAIRYGHYPEKILKKEVFEPNYSNIYEASKGLQGRHDDPVNMKPIDLNIPEMTEEEAKSAKLWQKVDEVRSLLNGETHETDPSELLNDIYEIINEAQMV